VLAASGMNFSLADASDRGAAGETEEEPAGKKMCWWIVGSWLKPSPSYERLDSCCLALLRLERLKSIFSW